MLTYVSRIRHVKCDEAKPLCQRCTTQGYKCDGYEDFIQVTSANFNKKPGKVQIPPQLYEETTTQSRKSNQKCLLPYARIPSIQISLNSAENALLHHVRTCVVLDIAAASRPSDFWYNYVLPLAHSTVVIKHALCALGAAHQYFASDYGNPDSSRTKTFFSTEAMRRYNDAIGSLNSLVSSKTSTHLDVVLICCVIFITIENLNGRSAEAACHLRAGCSIVKRLRARKTTAAPKELIGRDNIDGLLFALEDMLCCFGQYLAAYVGLDAFADLDFNLPVLSMGDPGLPFASLREAEMMLRNMDHAFYSRMRKAEAYWPQPSNLADIFADRTKSLESQGPVMDCDSRNAAKMAARSDLAAWKRRFEPLARRNKDPRNNLALSLDHAIWGIVLGATKHDEAFATAECEAVLSLAEDIISLDATADYPRFTFDGNLVWALFYICFGSRDAAIHRRCIKVLRSANRREGVWDSRDVAVICETAIAALNSNNLSWEDIPHGILTLADMLQVRPRGFSLESVRDLEAELARGKC